MQKAIICALPFLSGCAALKTASVAGVSAAAGGLVGGPVGAAAAAAVGAGATTLLTSGSISEVATPITGFWPLMGQVIQTGGWLLAGIVLLPLILGYLIPNGFERKKGR